MDEKRREQWKLNKAKWRRENRQEFLEKHRRQANKTKERNRAYINEWKIRLGCQDCGIDNPAVLDAHHIGVKTFSIGHAVRGQMSIAKIQLELEQCIPLCANCHRLRHYLTEHEQI